jgi:hypothetical protein
MRNDDSKTTAKTDVQHLNRLLRKRCMPGWLVRAAVLVTVTFVWVWIGKQILIGGSLVSYDLLQSLGPQVVSFMTQINPYLWWAVTIALSLIVLSLAHSWFKASVKRGRQGIVSVTDIQSLAQDMSPEGAEVLLWTWDHEAGPVTIGDLIGAREQISSGRVRKLANARAQHQALLNASTKASLSETEPESPTSP